MDIEFFEFLMIFILLSILFNVMIGAYNKKVLNKYIRETSVDDLYKIKKTFDYWLHKNLIKDDEYKGSGSSTFTLTAIDGIKSCPFSHNSIEIKFLQYQYGIKVDYDHESSVMDIRHYTIPHDYINSSRRVYKNKKSLRNDGIIKLNYF